MTDTATCVPVAERNSESMHWRDFLHLDFPFQGAHSTAITALSIENPKLAFSSPSSFESHEKTQDLIKPDPIFLFQRPLKCESTTPKTSLPIARLLLNLKAVDDRSQLAQDLVGLFVIFQLCSYKICEVA